MRKLTSILFCAVMIMCAYQNAHATTIRVPSDASTIQQAINSSVNGDLVLVAAGTYIENINFLGKAITVTSAGGAAVTVIDGNNTDTVVTFISGEGSTSILSGFTIKNGRSDYDTPGFGDGGGIRISNSSPTIKDNVIGWNQACGGAGISITSGGPTIERNNISNNTIINSLSGCQSGMGGGISVIYNSPTQILNNVISNNLGSGGGGGISLFSAGTSIIKDNIIKGNTATGIIPCSEGGGLLIVNSSNEMIIQNLIIGNEAGCGGGISWSVPVGERGPLLVNNTIVDNDGQQGSGIFADGFDSQTEVVNNIIVAKTGQTAVYCGDFDLTLPIFRSNNIFSPSGLAYGGICANQTGTNGNISANPLFTNQSSGDYHLRPYSPSLDTGDNAASNLPDTDLDGNPRTGDGNGDGVAVVDMGVYEYKPAVSVPTMTDAGLVVFTIFAGITSIYYLRSSRKVKTIK